MIPRRAVAAFLKRKRDSHESWKNLSDQELDRRAAKLPFHPPIWRALMRRQKICLLLGARYKRFAFLNDTGTGKTMACIALSRYFIECGARGIFLALVPRKPNKTTWVKEIKKHSPASRALVLEGSSKQKWKALRSTNADIVIETYAGLIRMLCEEGQNKKGDTKLKPKKKLVDEMKSLLSGLFLDESSEIKNRNKLPYRLCKALSKAADYVFLLTATPMGRDPIDLWAQINLVDDGWSLGETLGLFRAAFYSESVNYWGGIEYSFLKKYDETVQQFLLDRSIRFEADPDELPKVRPFKIICRMSKDAGEYYARHRDALMRARGNFQEMKNSFTRMRQISSGFIGYKDDDTGEKAQFEFKDKPKLEALIDFFWDHAGKMIIFHEYKVSGRLIRQALERQAIKCELLNGDNSDDADDILSRFDDDPKLEALILNNSVGAFGLNLQAAKWAVFYESPTSPIYRYQARRRVERQFSFYKWVGICDLVTKGTVDEDILAFLKEGQDIFEVVVQGRSRARKRSADDPQRLSKMA